jgi:hypothetical protein
MLLLHLRGFDIEPDLFFVVLWLTIDSTDPSGDNPPESFVVALASTGP